MTKTNDTGRTDIVGKEKQAMAKMPTYFEWHDGDYEYHVEYDPTTGVVLVETDLYTTQGNRYDCRVVGVYRFEKGLLVEAFARDVLPDALADTIEEYYKDWSTL